jgi:hypothetical protein
MSHSKNGGQRGGGKDPRDSKSFGQLLKTPSLGQLGMACSCWRNRSDDGENGGQRGGGENPRDSKSFRQLLKTPSLGQLGTAHSHWRPESKW